MGFFDDVIGGTFGAEGSPAQVVDPTPTEFKQIRPQIAEGISSFIGGEQDFLSSDISQNLGQFSFAPTEGELGALSNISGRAGTLTEGDLAARNLLGRTVSGEFLSPESNPFLQQTIDAAVRPLRESFERVTLPGLAGKFTKLGQTIRPGETTPRSSSPFNTAAAFAQGDFLRNVGDISSKISFQNFENERQRQQQATGDVNALRGEDIRLFVEDLRAQALPRLIQEVGLDRALQQFNQFTSNLLASLGLGTQAATSTNLQIPAVPSTPSIAEDFLRSAAAASGHELGSGEGAKELLAVAGGG